MSAALEAHAIDVPALRVELDALASAGARTFDPPAFDFAMALVTKAETLTGAAAARLFARAAMRVSSLAAALAQARTRAEAALASVPDPDGALARALRDGAFDRVVRAARRVARVPPPARDGAWIARLEAKTRARGMRPIAGGARALTHALYEASRAEVAATIAALRAEADLPEAAGPYNPQALAAATLAELAALSPAYLAALVAHLGELGVLLALPPVSASESRAPALSRRKRAR